MNETEKFKYYFEGNGDFWHTNKWNFECKRCTKEFIPSTTIMAKQNVQCPKCGQEELINYNTSK
jgi:DNA-directed RNA polymerase subunit RPC12/RpoP